jgi:hypothetical protein
MDERYKLHRLYSTRFAVLIVAVMMAVWFNYEYFINKILRWDLFIFLVTLAVAKLVAMLYYRKFN